MLCFFYVGLILIMVVGGPDFSGPFSALEDGADGGIVADAFVDFVPACGGLVGV